MEAKQASFDHVFSTVEIAYQQLRAARDARVAAAHTLDQLRIKEQVAAEHLARVRVQAQRAGRAVMGWSVEQVRQ